MDTPGRKGRPLRLVCRFAELGEKALNALILFHLEKPQLQPEQVMKKKQWQSEGLGDGFNGLAERSTPRMARREFELVVTGYLKGQRFPHKLPPTLLASLFSKTFHCLETLEALQKMRPLVRGGDWKVARRILRRLTHKDLPALLSRLRKDRNPSWPLTDAFVSSALLRIEAVKEDLELTARLARNDEELVSGYLKPELETQFMLELDNHLAKRLPPGTKIQDRRLVVCGCVLAAKFFPSDASPKDLQDRIHSRIERARHSNRSESTKWKWAEQE
jgi:hypothetical protein